jgi:hypothetical protein
MKCLQKDQTRRYATAAELAEDLRHFLEGEPVLARPVRVWERGWKWVRRRPTVKAFLWLTGLVALGALAFWALQ